MKNKAPKCHFCEHDRGPFDNRSDDCKRCKDGNEFQLKTRLTPMARAEYLSLCEKEAWANDKSVPFDRDTALMVLKALTTLMHPGRDIFGEPTLVIRRDNFELVRKKFLD